MRASTRELIRVTAGHAGTRSTWSRQLAIASPTLRSIWPAPHDWTYEGHVIWGLTRRILDLGLAVAA